MKVSTAQDHLSVGVVAQGEDGEIVANLRRCQSIHPLQPAPQRRSVLLELAPAEGDCVCLLVVPPGGIRCSRTSGPT
jgi:hypothetical protein